MHIETFAQECLGLGERVAKMIMRNSLDDVADRIAPVFARRASESVEALKALENLKRLEAITPLPFFDCLFRAALGTRRVWLCGWDVVHREMVKARRR